MTREDLEKKCPNDPWVNEADAIAKYPRLIHAANPAAKGIEVGCGGRKAFKLAIGIDLLIGGQFYKDVSVVASGDKLPYADGELDYVISNHNIEHYLDPLNTFNEWRRVLKVGGVMAFCCPDCWGLGSQTFTLNAQHKYVTSLVIMKELVAMAGGFELLEEGVPIPKWSIYLAYKKV